MVERLAKDLYRIGVRLPNNPLKELNCYFVRGTDSDLVIDTGFNRPECKEALFRGLEELGSEPERRDVFVTHCHADHSGLAPDCAGRDRKIYISRTDYAYERMSLDGTLVRKNAVRFLSEGFPSSLLRAIALEDPAQSMQMSGLDHRLTPIDDGGTLKVGGYTFQVVVVPGHTPGNAMLWEEANGFMFSGDHILFDITPNITCWYGVEDSLGLYLESLKKVSGYPVRRTFPGHRGTGDHQQRIGELLAHHAARLCEIADIIRETPGQCAYEIASRMTWNISAKSWEGFPQVQKYFAVGECLSHLDHLAIRGLVERRQQAGIYRYY